MTRSRNAFTLVELLVVIAIIAIIAALIFPAVQSTREAMRRTACVNSLKQLAHAAMLHESRKGRLPGRLELIGGKRANWVVPLLPDLEGTPVYDTWADDSVSFADANRSYLPTLYCQSRPGRVRDENSNSYIANLGFAPRATDASPFSGSVSAAPPTSGYDYWKAHRKANGPFVDRYTSKVNNWNVPEHLISVSSTDFHDGRGNTILFSENAAAGRWDETGLPTGMVWLYANESGVPVDQGYVTHALIPPSAVPPDARINANLQTINSILVARHARPSSWHPGGVNVAFADGSTKFMSEKIEYHVYQSLLTLRNDHSDMPHRRYVLNGSDFEL